MTILDKIKGLLIDVNIKLSNVTGNKFSLFNYEDNRKILVIGDDGKTKGLKLAALDKQIEEKIEKLLKEADKGTLIANNDSEKLLKEASESLKTRDNVDLLSFFQNKIPSEDFTILSASLVIRDKFNKGKTETVSILRRQLAQTYGDKANQISNLCTAKYFEDFLIPFYKEMSKAKDFTIEEFKRAYVKLISDFPVAIFINAFESKKEVEQKIRNKIESNKKYSVPYLNIHGIGQGNIKTIKYVISKLKHHVDYSDMKVELDEPIIIVRLRFD